MYKVKVFDESVQQWREISLWNDEYHGYGYDWLSDVGPERARDAFAYAEDDNGNPINGTLADAFEVADLLCFHSDGSTRAGIWDSKTGTIIYDTAAPTDLRQHPDFRVYGEAEWVDEFCHFMSMIREKARPDDVVQLARRLYAAPDHKYFPPGTIMWAYVIGDPVLPLAWPYRRKSAVQRGVEPGT